MQGYDLDDASTSYTHRGVLDIFGNSMTASSVMTALLVQLVAVGKIIHMEASLSAIIWLILRPNLQ